jgi:hypothetical protein
MLDTLQGLSALTIAEIVGPVVLAAAIVYGIYHSRRGRSAQPRNKSGTIYAQDN